MNAFEAWNLRLLQTFFPAGSDGKEVFIGTSPEVLDKIGPDLGGDAGFLRAVRAGPGWRWSKDDFVTKLNELKARRTSTRQHVLGYTDPSDYDSSLRHLPRSSKTSAPAYIPYLAMFARTAAVAKSSGFYARLRQDLALPDSWGSGQMKRVEDLWDDLQEWTRATSGYYGRFVVRRLGKFPYIGLAKSQVIISARDIPVLHGMFMEHGLPPHQGLSSGRFETLIEAMGDDHALSAGLRQAAKEDDYREELMGLLASIHSAWDGSPEVETDSEAFPTFEAKFGLTLGEDNVLPWCLQVAIQEDEDPGADEGGDTAWRFGHHLGLGLVGRLEPKESLAFLNGRDWMVRTCRHAMRIQRRLLWVLTGRNTSGRFELWEDALPEHGRAWLLATEEGSRALGDYLDKEKPSYDEVLQLDGLPSGWRMVYLDKCQDLSDRQRNLPNGQGKRPWMIGFEGGVSTLDERGRTYLHYDLPRVVLNASPEVSIRCNVGDLIPLDGGQDDPPSSIGLPLVASARRFELPREVENGGEFTLEAIDSKGRIVGTRTLTILDRRKAHASDGVHGSPCLDHLGRTTSSDVGLRGGLPAVLVHANGGEPGDADLPVGSGELGNPMDPRAIEANPSARFLDALAKDGSMTYGRAKALLHRLLPHDGNRANSWHLVMDLWLRGYVEVERTKEGRVERVHAVPPCAYALPAINGNSRLLGILGTMTLRHWAVLAQHGHGWEAFSKVVVDKSKAGWSYLPSVRLSTRWPPKVIVPSLEKQGLGFLPMQGLALARWSVSESQARNELLHAAKEDPPSSHPRKPRRLDPRSGRFLPSCDGLRRPHGVTSELVLYDFEDAHVEGWRNHVVASKGGYSLAMDVHWAIWITRGACGMGLRNLMPNYDESRRQFWLPSSLRLPIVLERALVLCSGRAPDEYQMRIHEEGGRTWLRLAKNNFEVRQVDKDLYGGYANDRWLLYNWVPPSVIYAIQAKSK
jgi:hypothetical protein